MSSSATVNVRVLRHERFESKGERRSSLLQHLPLRDRLLVGMESTDIEMVEKIERIRPESLRDYDQIPMRALDLIRQARLTASYLAGKSVAFVGDHDCASLLLGMLSVKNGLPQPRRMLVLDFDERLLERISAFARRHGLGDLIECRLYNVFDSLPSDLCWQFDWFYINPPYGSRNDGLSPLLFISRGAELVKKRNGSGCIILPDDKTRPWTSRVMHTVQSTLCMCGWSVSEKLNGLHQYHLDDDQELSSSLLLVNSVRHDLGDLPYLHRPVGLKEIPNFYGQSVKPPYPRYILKTGKEVFNWKDRAALTA